jgi:nucleoside 2-deoxyribosyltransferase
MSEGLDDKICPICQLEDDAIKKKRAGAGSLQVSCPRCKNFILSFEALIAIGGNQGPIPKLSAWIRDFNENQNDGPEIHQESLEEIPASIPDYSVREKQIKLLRNIERKTAYPGDTIKLLPKCDIPLAWASGEEEFRYYLNSLIDRGLLRITATYVSAGPIPVTITADGWDYLEKLERHIEERTQAFVAMSFSEDLKTIWEGPIKNAISKAGYKPYRVDAEPHSDRIDAKIISEIKNSRFLVADVTQHRPGVYFEAGYALGLGLTVIWCVRNDDLNNVHFDTRQYNHIVWEDENPDYLENKLYDFICAIIGKRKEK